MFKAITAHSAKTDSKDVATELLRESSAQLGIYRPSAGILYASCPHDTETLKDILQNIIEAFPEIQVIGGTVIGGFTDNSGYMKDGYFLCLLVSDTTILATGCIKNLPEVTRTNQLGHVFRTYLRDNFLCEDPTACFLLSSYNHIDGNALIDAIHEVLPEECIIFGGMATDYWDEYDLDNFSKKTPPIDNNLLFFVKNGSICVEDELLVFLLFKGNITIKYEVPYGWSDVGMCYPGRAEGPIITEIDGKSPHTFLKELKHPLSSDDNNNFEYPLWFHVPGKDPHLRDIFHNRSNNVYSTQGTSLPSHFHVSFSFPTKEKVLKEFNNCLARIGGENSLVIATTCCFHQIVLGNMICEEYAEMKKFFHNTPFICGYVFGEFGPSFTTPKSMLHSCSSVLICLQEETRNIGESSESLTTFLNEIIREQRKTINSLERQLRFFEGSKYNKLKTLTEDCLGILLNRSNKSLSSHAEQLSDTLKKYYENKNVDPPYATSRNRLIEHLMTLKKHSLEIIIGSKK